ncbi:MAG: hypothetical protein ABI852_19145, partial [Gemmatimonadaceae bacterium]
MFLTKRESTATLDDVRPRLQHYLRAMYGEGLAVESLAPPKKPNVAVRLLQKVALVKQNGASESSAQCIRLPESIPTLDSGATPLEQYRVMAVQHAERLRRATATHARSVSSNLERDLYQLAESLTIDTQIAESQPGLCAALKAARAESMTRRPKPRWRTDIELRVEEMFQRAWPSFTVAANSATQTGATLHADLPPVPHNNDAESNATWARRTAVTLESMYGRKAAQTYRRVPEITLWHTSVRTELPENQLSAIETETQQRKSDSPTPEWDAPNRSIIPGGASSRGGDKSPGNTPDQSDNGKPSSHKDSGGAADGGVDAEPSRDKGPPKTNRNSASKSNMLRPAKRAQEQRKRSPQHDDHTEATQTTSLDGVGDQSGVDHSEHAVDDAQLAEGITFRYPEWDFNAHTFTEGGTVVRVVPPPLGPSDWATLALQEHARETHLAKRQFERLRSHRLRLRRQVQGDELDLEACVEAMVDRCMRVPPSDRLYSQARPGRRDLAITLLIDVSGSTGEMVTGEQRVIDLERIAALVATAAFDAL